MQRRRYGGILKKWDFLAFFLCRRYDTEEAPGPAVSRLQWSGAGLLLCYGAEYVIPSFFVSL